MGSSHVLRACPFGLRTLSAGVALFKKRLKLGGDALGMPEPEIILPFLGVGAGLVLGFCARVNRFCTLSALERFWYAGDASGLRTWALAAATAMAFTQGLVWVGVVDIGQSFYLQPSLPLTGAILGGLMFGFGMALVGTCGFGAIIRLGGGSLRALVVLIALGLCAMAVQRGVLAQLRVPVIDNLAIDLSSFPDQAVSTLISSGLGFDMKPGVVLIILACLLFWIFRDRDFRNKRLNILTGFIVGAVISFGWFATSWVSREAFVPIQIEAGAFVVPIADTVLQVITYTGTLPDYGVGLMIGTLAGAAGGAFWQRDIRWEACDDARELSRHLGGAALMGVGGVISMGCTIGQGISAFSTLAVSAPIVMIAIAIGARFGLAYLIEGSIFAALRRNGNADLN